MLQEEAEYEEEEEEAEMSYEVSTSNNSLRLKRNYYNHIMEGKWY